MCSNPDCDNERRSRVVGRDDGKNLVFCVICSMKLDQGNREEIMQKSLEAR